jgi:hypothetical protein
MLFRIYSGAINVITGQRKLFEKNAVSTQDFVVTPKQKRLDGFCVGNEHIRQFVAMPLGKKYGVEQQLTGQERIGGVQPEIAPRYKTSVLLARVKRSGTDTGECISCPNEEALDTALDLFLTPSEAGFLPGQCLFIQPLPNDNPRRSLFNDPSDFPKEEFFGTAIRKQNHDFKMHRPTFLRELMAWAPDTESLKPRLKVEVVPPIIVPIPWEWNESTSLHVSPFVDIRHITYGLLKSEATLQHVSNFPIGPYSSISMRAYRSIPKTSYRPLYFMRKEETAVFIKSPQFPSQSEETHTNGGDSDLSDDLDIPAPRMALAAGGTREQRIIKSNDKRMFAWKNSVVLNLHLLNSVAFRQVTGLAPVLCLILFQEYANARLPFFRDIGTGLHVEKESLSTITSVQKLDMCSAVVWDVVLEVAGKCHTGCAFCEINLVNTM